MGLQQNLYRFAACTLTHYRNYVKSGEVEETLTKFIDSVSILQEEERNTKFY